MDKRIDISHWSKIQDGGRGSLSVCGKIRLVN